MDLCGCKYNSHQIEGILQVLHKSTATSNYKEMFKRFLSTAQLSNSSSSEGEEAVDSNMNLSEKLQNIMDKFTAAKKCSNTERNQHLAKGLAIL